MDWYPHHIDDYDADTLDLTAFEDGVYSRLIRWYYKNERPLPAGDQAWAAIARIGLAEWLPIADKIRGFFVTRLSRVTNAAEWHHKRCNTVLTAQNKKRHRSKERQEKYRQRNMLDDNITPSRVSNAHRVEERRVVDETESVATTQSPTSTELVESIGGSVKIPPPDPMIPDFDVWYANAPRKVGKGQALKAYRAARKKTDPQTLLEGITRYGRERHGQDPAYTKHPSTWLNGECWNDQPGAAAAPRVGNGRAPDDAAVFRKILAEDRGTDDLPGERPHDNVVELRPDEYRPATRSRPSALPD